MDDSGESFEICLRCGEPNPEGTSRCLKCKSPLDPSARDHPWELKTANHHAYSDAASPRSKPIIFWGVWLYFGPSAIFMIILIRDFLTGYLGDDPFYQLDSSALISLILPLGYGLLSIWALWSVTKGYLGKRSEP